MSGLDNQGTGERQNDWVVRNDIVRCRSKTIQTDRTKRVPAEFEYVNLCFFCRNLRHCS